MLDYLLIRKKRKGIMLTIKKGEITVTAPLKLAQRHIDEFIDLKKNWIIKKVEQYKEKQSRFEQLLNYSAVLLFGKQYNIEFSNNQKVVAIDENTCFIPIKYFEQDKTSKLKKALIAFCRKKGYDYLKERLEYIAGLSGLHFLDFGLTNAKTKWGSCDTKNRILLNWRLIMLKEPLIDYVIIHELCHTLEHNHSKKFWSNVQKLCPLYKAMKSDLKQNSIINELLR